MNTGCKLIKFCGRILSNKPYWYFFFFVIQRFYGFKCKSKVNAAAVLAQTKQKTKQKPKNKTKIPPKYVYVTNLSRY